MSRIPRAPLIGVGLLGLAVALAVLVLGQGGAGPAAAYPAQPHYKCYDIPPGATPVPTVTLLTQFGGESLSVGPPAKLCLPAGKDGEPTPGPGVPHLKCYLIAGHDAERTVNLETQFGVENNVAVGHAVMLCVSVTKTLVGTPVGPQPIPDRDYECYSIAASAPGEGTPTPTPVATVTLRTQFGTEADVAVKEPSLLCAPAGENGTPVPGPEVPHLKCYNITGDPANREVNLTTHFGVEENVPVLVPSLVCVPADKQVVVPTDTPTSTPTATKTATPTPTRRPGPVGGVAELPALAGTSGEEAGTPAEGSGWSAASYAALAGGLAAAVVALSAGWWYARRRLLR